MKIKSAEQIGIYVSTADDQCKNGPDAENTGRGHMPYVLLVLWLLKQSCKHSASVTTITAPNMVESLTANSASSKLPQLREVPVTD